MRFGDLIGVALSRLGTGKLRTVLTMLGVIIGVASVVALVSVAQGATKGISDRLQSLGTNLVTVSPGFTRQIGSVTRGVFGGGTSTLTLDDATAIAKLDGVATIAPELQVQKLVVAGTQNETVRITGTTSGFAEVFAYSVWTGRFLNDASVENGLRVAVIGSTTADNLGLTAADVGTNIQIGGLPFQLIGILQPKGGSGSQDDVVLVPITTVRELFAGTQTVNTIGVSATGEADISYVSAEITALLEQRHGIAAGASDDFTITTQAQLLGTVSNVSDILTLLLAGIASISLLVGGIGIMNIMLVSVRERTREIGIRKAIGAKGSDILSQFLVEALALSLAGGTVGILLGVGASFGIGLYAGWGFVFNPFTVVVALGFSLIVGIVFGVWPASQAASLDPVVALRYE